MIPNFVTIKYSPWGLLPEGIHQATLEEVEARFAFNEHRKRLFNGLSEGVHHLFSAGCESLLLDGSYVTEKPDPNDFDVLWNPKGVTNICLIDPIILSFETDKKREKQKEKYLGEFIPSIVPMTNSKQTFLDFFQTDKHSGKKKGIIQINNWLKDLHKK